MQEKIHFNSIETASDESVFLRAEELYDGNGISDIIQSNKNSWLIVLYDKGHVHRVKLSKSLGDYFDNIECDCNVYTDSSMCAHVIASMIAIRKRITCLAQSEKIIHPRSYRKPQSSFGALIQSASKDQLAAFAKRFASKNKKFYYELSFDIIGQNDEDKAANLYKEFLERLVRDLTLNESISNSNRNFYIKSSESIIIELDYLIAKTSYVKAFDILKSLWENTLIVRKKITSPEDLDELILSIEEITSNLIGLVKSPELIKRCFFVLKEISVLSYYPVLNPESNLFFLLLSHRRFSTYIKNYSDELEEALLHPRTVTKVRIKTYFNYLISSGQSIDTFRSRLDYFKEKGIISYVSNKTYHSSPKDFENIELLKLLFSLTDSIPEQKRIALNIIDISLQNKKIKEALKYGMEFYQIFEDIIVLKGLTNLPDITITKLNNMISIIENISITIRNHISLFFELYYGSKDLFVSKLISADSLIFLSHLDHQYLKSIGIDIATLYIQIIELHLSNHHGSEARKFILGIVHQLLHKGMISEHEKIIDACQNSFSVLRSVDF